MSTPVRNYPPLTHLGNMPVEYFLQHYWQQKPLLIRQAFPNFSSPLSADEIAGFAVDSDVVSRLVIEDPAKQHWQLQHGPLPATIFTTLPESHWTLLIQHADSLDLEINALLNAFRFIPNWRLDDIMVSYATNDGGVGPHFDYFDVFLLQGQGKRHWQLGQYCDNTTALIPDQPMKILAEFITEQEWVLEPGDVLYIPPQFAHWGKAMGESITYSIGFRAPSHSDILLDFSAEMASLSSGDQRFTDPQLQGQQHSGEISADAIQTIKDILLNYCNDDNNLAQWLGQYTTSIKQDFVDNPLPALTLNELTDGIPCQLNPFARCAYWPSAKLSTCFINGQSWQCSQPLAEALSGFHSFTLQDFNSEDQIIIVALGDEGLLTSIDYVLS